MEPGVRGVQSEEDVAMETARSGRTGSSGRDRSEKTGKSPSRALVLRPFSRSDRGKSPLKGGIFLLLARYWSKGQEIPTKNPIPIAKREERS